jgi:hypothetical protein
MHCLLASLLDANALRIGQRGGEMVRIRHHHPKRSPRRSDLLKRNEAIRGRNFPMQKNLDIIHFNVLNVFSLFNLLFPLPLAFLLGCFTSNNYEHLKDRIEPKLNSLAKGDF